MFRAKIFVKEYTLANGLILVSIIIWEWTLFWCWYKNQWL